VDAERLEEDETEVERLRGHNTVLLMENVELLAEVERLRAVVRQVLEHHTPYPMAKGAPTWCIVCAPVDGRWPCVTAMIALAVLEAKP